MGFGLKPILLNTFGLKTILLYTFGLKQILLKALRLNPILLNPFGLKPISIEFYGVVGEKVCQLPLSSWWSLGYISVMLANSLGAHDDS